jgi:hypothetical protein
MFQLINLNIKTSGFDLLKQYEDLFQIHRLMKSSRALLFLKDLGGFNLLCMEEHHIDKSRNIQKIFRDLLSLIDCIK